MPDFLQLKQNPRVSNFKEAFFGDRRRTLKTLAFLVLIVAIPVTVWLIQFTQIFAPRAAGAPIELVSGGDCVLSTDPNEVDCATVPIRLTSSLGPPEATDSASPSPSGLLSPTPSSSPAASPSGSPLASPSPSPSPVTSPSPSLSPSPAASVVASPSPSTDKIACMNSALGISGQVTAVNKNNSTLVYWKSGVGLGQLTNAASTCGVQLLNPTNFTSATLESLVRSVSAGSIRSVWVEGPCTTQKVDDYRNNGIRVSADVQCDEANLDHKVYPTPNAFDGIGDFTSGGDAAVVIPSAQASTESWFEKLAGFINWEFPGSVNAQTAQVPAVTCVGSGLNLSNPTIVQNTKQSGTSLVYWNTIVNRDNFINKAQECGASILKPGNFLDAEVKGLVQGVTGAPAGNSDNSKYRNVVVEGPCSSAKLAAYSSAGHATLADNQCNEPGIDYKVNQYYGPGSGANPFGVYSGIADGGTTGYPVIVISSTDSSPSPSGSSSSNPSSSPLVSSSPTSSNNPSTDPSSRTLKYRLAETEAGLATAEFKDYTSHPLLTDFTFSDPTPGVKQIWVEFVSTTNESRKEHITVELVGDGPTITSLDCSMDISRQNLKLTVNGRNLGASGGKIAANNKDAQVNSWNEGQITATIKPDGNLEQGSQFKVKVTTNEDEVLPEVICEVNTSLISLGARLFCRAPGKFDVAGVKVSLVDENGNKVDEEVSIDANGLIKGLKTRLQVGKPYVLSIKSPNSLRKNIDFTAANGTNVVKPADDDSLILPIGDIAPVILPDGKINVPDRAELVRQWSVLGGGTTIKTGDFNRDARVNSIDWACMRFDFNKEDEGFPTRAVGIPGASPTPGTSSSPSSSVSASTVPSPSPSMSPLPSGQRAGFFLIDPLEGGSYPNGDEFIVDINIWSQIEAANLFVAKLSYDETALEVVRIERGPALSTWAEEFFNNQTGQISLVAGKPSPGLKTDAGQDVRLARIIFKGKKVGVTEIVVTNESRIFSNQDNTNILTSLLSSQIEITN